MQAAVWKNGLLISQNQNKGAMLLNALKAEYIKTKASGLKWLLLGASLFIPLIGFLINLFVDEVFLGKSPVNPWMDFIQNSFSGFAPFFYPLLCVLIVVRMAQFEHKADAWKLLETQPVPKWALYFSKWIMALVVALLSLLLVLLFSVIAVYILSIAKPIPEYKTSSFEWTNALWLVVRIWISGLGLMAIQYMLSVLVSNFVTPFIVGLIATIAGSIMVGFQVLIWWPYAAPSLSAASAKTTSAFLLPTESMSILFMMLFLFIGFRMFVYKKVEFSFFKPATRVLPLVMVLLIFGAGFWYINKAKVLSKHTATVIAGTIESDEKTDKLYLINPVYQDTVDVIPVLNNRFNKQIHAKLPASYYLLKVNNKAQQIFMGDKDSVYVEIKHKKTSFEAEITGTREAENEFTQSNRAGNNLWFLENNAYQYKPKDYARQVLKELKDQEENLQKFKTATNIKPAEDFIQFQSKLIKVRMLSLLDQHYPRIFSVYYPNDKLEYPKSVEELRKQTPIADSSLLIYYEYIQFVMQHYRSISGATNEPMLYAYITEKMPAGMVKDVVLYKSLTDLVSRTGDSTARAFFIDNFSGGIQNNRLKSLLLAKNNTMNGLKKGKPAPVIHAETLNGTAFNLAMFKNRFVVIDVWATWCGPCKKEAPYFKEIAERLTSENLAFVSLSVDEDKNAWKKEAAYQAEKVLQLWLSDAKEMNAYNIESIPRFMFIDNKGRIINANMPRPSDPEFEEIIKKETAFLDN